MSYMIYVSITDGHSERAERADPAEEAYIIDRTLLPLAGGAEGYANSRLSGYRVRGDLGSKRATLQLLDDGTPIAVVAVCLHSRASPGLWKWLYDHATAELPDMTAPPAPWVAMRYDCPEAALPPWIDNWAKGVGTALLAREGW
jgi:hypothetical protein